MESGRLLSGRGTDCRGCGQDLALLNGADIVVARSSGCDCRFGGNLQLVS